MPTSTTTPHPTTSGHSATVPGVANSAAGNTRLAYIHEGGTITKAQETHYYPFGMRITPLSNQPLNLGTERNNAFLYNGKEFNDDFGLNWGACPVSYGNYGVRFYDPQLGRWHSVDPLAEITYSWTPYRYGFNNPLCFIDPNGMSEKDIYGRDRFNGDGIYIPPHERENSTRSNGSFFGEVANTISTAIFDIFLEEEKLPNGNKVLNSKDEISSFVGAIEGGPVAIILSGSLAAQMFTGGFDYESGVVIVLKGDDIGVYPLIDIGIPVLTSDFSISGGLKLMPVFYQGNPETFGVDMLKGTRIEANSSFPGTPVLFGGMTSLSGNEAVFGAYLGFGKSIRPKGLVKFSNIDLQINTGVTDVAY